MTKRKTVKQFIKEAIDIHGDTYDYASVIYINSKTKIDIKCIKHGIYAMTPDHHINRKQGCRRCGETKRGLNDRKTTKQFIKEAVKVHGDMYDYSFVEYNGNKNSVKIVCKQHGIIDVNPKNHLNGAKCKACSLIKISIKSTKTTGQFIKDAIVVHGNKYSYTKVKYIKAIKKVDIICKKHGSFLQTPHQHLSGSGCPRCGLISGIEKGSKTTEEFIQEAEKIHGDKYDYSKTVYSRYKEKVTIFCNKHKYNFMQTPNDHLSGCGCQSCGQEISGSFNPNKPAILYYLSINNGEAYKIGITNRTVKERFANDIRKIKVLKTIKYAIGYKARLAEITILEDFKYAKWKGVSLLKDGNTELFDRDILGLDSPSIINSNKEL